MIRNGNRVRRSTTLKADVCIVGAGAAGISIAQALAGSRLRVIVLESGGLSADVGTQSLYEGRVVGTGQPPLNASRLRYFGGSTNHWSGWCGPFEASDFAERPWVADSGWPITFDDLAPYYRRAHEVCDLGPFDYGESAWGVFARPLPDLAEHGARLALIQHSKPTRFGAKYGEALAEAANVRVLLESNLIELSPDREVRTVQRAKVVTLAGNRFFVASRIFILACGSIENARLLLSSNGVAPKGLGNDRDLVGRYFMDHPRVRPAGGVMWIDGRAEKIEQYSLLDGIRATLGVSLDFGVQQRERLTNSIFFAETATPIEEVAKDRRADAETARFLQRLGRHADAVGLSEWWVRCEQSPNRSSRVTLSEERDTLGLRRPVLDWRLQDLDRHTLSRASRAYAEILTRAALGRVKIVTWLLKADDAPSDDPAGNAPAEGWELVTGDWHQLGTTRMADAPERGVVDADCKVFGLDNLFIAGASVFSTSGAMNPTLTLVALALRLADHIEKIAP
jgi:choline dehydrogenase-like flavoprotein